MMLDYGASVNTVSGSVGPLYYSTMKIVRTMVDSGSSVMIHDFSTFL